MYSNISFFYGVKIVLKWTEQDIDYSVQRLSCHTCTRGRSEAFVGILMVNGKTTWWSRLVKRPRMYRNLARAGEWQTTWWYSEGGTTNKHTDWMKCVIKVPPVGGPYCYCWLFSVLLGFSSGSPRQLYYFVCVFIENMWTKHYSKFDLCWFSRLFLFCAKAIVSYSRLPLTPR